MSAVSHSNLCSGDGDPVEPGDDLPTAALETLRQRAVLLDAIREYFNASGYWEVETPILSADTVIDAWLEPFVTRDATSAKSPEMFLQTSPEFGMKRLLAAGAAAIFQITRAFRQGETGPLHNPEFTMIEWYRAGDTYHDQMAFVEGLVTTVLQCGASFDSTNERPRPTTPFERMTYDDAFAQHAGARVLSLTADELAQLAERLGRQRPATMRADDRDGWLNLLLAECVEPKLGQGRPQFLYDYPASQAALARIRRDDRHPVAERFELYIDGIELCNGYQELTDPDEFRRRMQEQQALRESAGLPPLPDDNRLLQAMQRGLPECSGVALGFDRLAMIALAKTTLSEVMAFPVDRA